MVDRPNSMSGPLPSSFDDNKDFYNERPMQKVVRKIKEEPLVPLGIGLTTFALVAATRAVRKGDSKQANRMFRARVAAQGFTVVAMVAGSMYYSRDREKSKELRKLQEDHDAELKRQKWIRELEARDEEEKALKARLQRRAQEKMKAAKDEAESLQGQGEPSGGILGRMGLWSQNEQSAAEASSPTEAPSEGSPEDAQSGSKRENPKSSLGAIGEVIATKKRENEPKK